MITTGKAPRGVMTIWEGIFREAAQDQTLPAFLGLILTAAIVGAVSPLERRRLRVIVFLFALHLITVVAAGFMASANLGAHQEMRFAALFFAALAGVMMVGALIFSVLFPVLRISTPHILRDVLTAAAALVAFFALASRLGFNLSGLIATSAVLTAVIGFSLQDTLGNIMGGLALQLDNSVKVGDWIQIGETSGRVSEIRWRHTAIETRNWETVIVPNSLLMRGQMTILGRRHGEPLQWRRWIYFNIDFRFPPTDVITAVEQSLRNAPIERVAATPPPNCLLINLEDSFGRYAVRYWLTDLSASDATDSVVRTRIYFALQRARIALSMPAHAVFLTEDSSKRKERKARADFDRRLEAISHVDLFKTLSDTERHRIAESVLYAPYAKNETITKQGAEAHWLYVLVEGEVSVRVSVDGREREVSRLSAPEVIGEMSLMTGEPRGATVVALTDVECFRLDRAIFKEIVSASSELAEHLALLLARRKLEMASARDGLDGEAQSRRLAHDRVNLLESIRDFFGLTGDR